MHRYRGTSSSLLDVIDLERYSSLHELLAVTYRGFRFIANCRSGDRHRQTGLLKPQELSIALTLWVRAVQGQAFSRVIPARFLCGYRLTSLLNLV